MIGGSSGGGRRRAAEGTVGGGPESAGLRLRHVKQGRSPRGQNGERGGCRRGRSWTVRVPHGPHVPS